MNRALVVLLRTLPAAFAIAQLSACKENAEPTKPSAASPQWQMVAANLPSALLSVSGRSPTDIFTVGSDKGSGPLVLHYDGQAWRALHTGQTGDLWWVQAFPQGPALMSGAGATVLK